MHGSRPQKSSAGSFSDGVLRQGKYVHACNTQLGTHARCDGLYDGMHVCRSVYLRSVSSQNLHANVARAVETHARCGRDTRQHPEGVYDNESEREQESELLVPATAGQQQA